MQTMVRTDRSPSVGMKIENTYKGYRILNLNNSSKTYKLETMIAAVRMVLTCHKA